MLIGKVAAACNFVKWNIRWKKHALLDLPVYVFFVWFFTQYRNCLRRGTKYSIVVLSMGKNIEMGKHTIFLSPINFFTSFSVTSGNHSAGKSSFINWYVEEHVQRTGVAIETHGFSVIIILPSSRNHSEGKYTFINWYVEEHVQRTGVTIETQGFSFVCFEPDPQCHNNSPLFREPFCGEILLYQLVRGGARPAHRCRHRDPGIQLCHLGQKVRLLHLRIRCLFDPGIRDG